MTNEELIQRTFELAKKGLGTTWPNPMVGAVIVKDGRIIAEGYHRKSGEAHAELNAIQNAKESIEGATIFVNLEPCCHTNKKTPPCAQRLIQEKIKKVVICNLDPNPSVNGEGVKLLRDAGIEVTHGILTEEGEKLNEVFFTSQRNKRPFIHLKMAGTLDGRSALPSGESQWITGEVSRSFVHELRSLHQGIIVGAETVRKDNPKLNVRLPGFQGEQPYRIVFTRSGNLPRDAHLFNDELKHKTIVYTESPLSFSFPNVKIVRSLKEAMDDLYQSKIMNLMLEGGSILAGNFMKERMIDRVSLFLNPSFLGEGQSILGPMELHKLSERPKLHEVETKLIGGDFYITGRMS